MELLLFSFVAGLLTVLAPCVLPLLPVIIGGSLGGNEGYKRPLIITLSLALSITLFTLLLRATTAFIDIPSSFWKAFSGIILIILGVAYIFPSFWQKLMHITGLEKKTQQNLNTSTQKKGTLGMVATGMSLGPVFASCSPMYAFLLATVLPTSWAVGVANIIAYALGLAFIMFIVAFLGYKAIKNLKWASNPSGVFRKVLGVIFVLIGLAVWSGLDKQIEAKIIENGYFGVLELEQRLSEEACEVSDYC